VLGRADGVIKVAGHRLGTCEMEAVVSKHSDVAEVSCIGINDEVKGQVPICVIVLKADVNGNDELKREIIQ
jgi:acyl-coenzyme A synthetase/AMP-(fatty) acid ligase